MLRAFSITGYYYLILCGTKLFILGMLIVDFASSVGHNAVSELSFMII